jgi:thioredoxin
MRLKLTLPLLFLTCVVFTLTFAQAISLNATEFSTKLQNDSIQLLDVRTPQEYVGGHLANSLLADWNNQDEFNQRIQYLNKEKPIYVYCLGGGRSAAAQSYLINQGFKTVVNLTGGITSWKAKNLPVEGKKEVEQLSQKAFLQSMPKNELVLVDFSAEWCPPCKKMNPIVDELIKEGYSILKIDGGSQDELVKSYQIGSFPTLVLFKNGEEIKRVSGFQTKESLIELFK